MKSENSILIVDDEKDIIKVLKLFLEKEGITVYEAYDGEMAYALTKIYDIDLIILDIMMPKMNGYELTKKIRKERDIPIVIISAKIQLEDKILGLDMGADDYIVKPFEPLEVVSRIKAQLRRINKNKIKENEILIYGDLELDRERCIVKILSEAIDLTKSELTILEALIKRPGKVFTKEELFECAWADEVNGIDDNTIRVAISRLRDKIGEKYIKTIRGLGYRLEK